MNQTYKTQGIILKRWDYKERDKMVRILTNDFGKITTRAISARKITSKLAGHLEPFIHSDLFIAHSKTIDIVAGSNTIESHALLRQSLPHNAIANYFAEIIDRFTEERHTDKELFMHVLHFSNWLNVHGANTLVLYAAIIQLFQILRFHVELYRCHSCKQLIGQEGNKFYYALWNVECMNCSSHEETTPLSANVIKILRFLSKQPFDAVAQLRVYDAEWKECDTLIRSILHYHLDKDLRSEPIF